MGFVADVLLIAGALGAAFYCFVLSRRLARLNSLETGVGSAVAVMSAQVDDMTKVLLNAKHTAAESSQNLEKLAKRAENVAQRLELLLASMHDLPDDTAKVSAKQRMVRPREKSFEGAR